MPIRLFLVLAAFLISVLMWVDRACISAAKDNIASDLGFSDQQMGWVMAAFSLGYAFFQVPSGHLADRYGPRLMMTAVCLLWSLFTALTGVVRGLGGMLALRFLFGVGEAGGYPTLARAFTNWLPMNERGITNSISFSGGRLGAALAMPGVVWLIGALGGWQETFVFFGAIGIGVAIVWFMLFRDLPENHFAVSKRESDHIAATRVPGGLATPQASAAPLTTGRMLRSRNLHLLMIQYVAHNFTFFFTVTWFFPYIKKNYELTSSQAGLYAMAPLLCGVAGNWMAGFFVDRLYSLGRWKLSRRLPAAAGFALAAIGMSLCVNMTSPSAAVICMCLAIFGSDMILSPSWSTCMDIGGGHAGAVSGSMNMVGNLGAFFTALSFPYLRDALGSHQPFFYLAAGLNVLAIFLWFRIRPDLNITEEVGGLASVAAGDQGGTAD